MIYIIFGRLWNTRNLELFIVSVNVVLDDVTVRSHDSLPAFSVCIYVTVLVFHDL